MRTARMISIWAMTITGIAALACTTSLSAADNELAQEILKATGIHGGLMVHVGCGDGKLTAQLQTGNIIVHGLDRDAKNVEAARRYIAALDKNGQVTIEQWSGKTLPFVDNLVNLIVSQDWKDVSNSEVMRVLAPGGVAYIQQKGVWIKTVKPWPAQLDQWTHYLYDASNNPVSRDKKVGAPRFLQWMADPGWLRYHDRLASVSVLVSAQGRNFSIEDTGLIQLPESQPNWQLIARDAFNGKLLWRRTIPCWTDTARRFRSGPVGVSRVLVAIGDHVYAQLGVNAPIEVLDATTGKTITEFAQTKNTEEFIVQDGVLLAQLSAQGAEQSLKTKPAPLNPRAIMDSKSIVAIDVQEGKLLWSWPKKSTAAIEPLSLCAIADHAVCRVHDEIVCLDLQHGSERWRTLIDQLPALEADQKRAFVKHQGQAGQVNRPRSLGFTFQNLLLHQDVVLIGTTSRAIALDVADGHLLWQASLGIVVDTSQVEMFAIGDRVWLGPYFQEARDLHTGKVVQTLGIYDEVVSAGHHHRCYRNKATENFILFGWRGIELFDLHGDQHSRNNWVRGTCQYGIMPANGLLYVPPHNCCCYFEAKLYGLWALAAERKIQLPPVQNDLVQGPAYKRPLTADTSLTGDWPMYRHDELRSGNTASGELPNKLQPLWQVQCPGELTQAVVVGNLVVAVVKDQHVVIAWDVTTGKPRWSFLAGGRIDSSPTLYRGRVLFGASDGWIYCLDQADGALAWRFHAAPHDLNSVVQEQVESVWPSHGSVLLHKGLVYCSAGRSSWIDGGIRLYALDPATGAVVHRSVYALDAPKIVPNTQKIPLQEIVQNARDYKTLTQSDQSNAFQMDGATSDILASDGKAIFLHTKMFNETLQLQSGFGRHLYSTSSLLDENQAHRSHWVLGTGDMRDTTVSYEWLTRSHSNNAGRFIVPIGRQICFDHSAAFYTFQNSLSENGLRVLVRSPIQPLDTNVLHAADVQRDAAKPETEQRKWQLPLPFVPQGVLKAGNILYVSGGLGKGIRASIEEVAKNNKSNKRNKPTVAVPLVGDNNTPALWVVDANTGKCVATYDLPAPPTFDGMSVAGGRLYVALADGSLVSFGSKPN